MDAKEIDESQRHDLFRLAVFAMTLLVIAVNGGRYFAVSAGLFAISSAFVVLSVISVLGREPNQARIELRNQRRAN